MSRTRKIEFIICCAFISICFLLFAGCIYDENSNYSLSLTNDFQFTYYLNEEIDYDNLYVVFREKHGDVNNSQIIYLSNENLIFNNFDTSSLGKKTGSITYYVDNIEVSFCFEYEVIEKTDVVDEDYDDYIVRVNGVKSIISVGRFDYISFSEYVVGDDLMLNSTDTISYYDNNNERQVVRLKPEMITGFDTSSSGGKNMTITLGDQSVERSYIVYEEVDEILSYDCDKVFYLGFDGNIRGNVIEYRNKNGIVKNYEYSEASLLNSISGFDSSTLGTKTITLKFRHKVFEFNIEVKNILIKKVEGLKSSYTLNEILDLSNVFLVYNRDKWLEMTSNLITIDGFDSSTTGSKVMRIYLGDDFIDFGYIVN